jgi:acyl carrier protein
MSESDHVIAEIAKLLGIDSNSIIREAPLFSLANSSFRVVELVIELQEEFGVLFHQEDMNGVATVGDLVDLVVARRRESISA